MFGLRQKPSNFGIFLLISRFPGGSDSSVGKSSASHAGDPGLNPGVGCLTQVTPIHEWQGKRLLAVKVILHQLGLTDWYIMMIFFFLILGFLILSISRLPSVSYIKVCHVWNDELWNHLWNDHEATIFFIYSWGLWHEFTWRKKNMSLNLRWTIKDNCGTLKTKCSLYWSSVLDYPQTII